MTGSMQNPQTDPVAAMLAQTTLSNTLFAPTSRYYGQEVATFMQKGRPVAYLRRRFLPQPEQFQVLQQHSLVQGERLDTIAAQYLGDPTLFWRLCDANLAMRPAELTETPGRKLAITLPAGITGAAL
jgi:hypothetical protein